MANLEKILDYVLLVLIIASVIAGFLLFLWPSNEKYSCMSSNDWICSDVQITDSYLSFKLVNDVGFDTYVWILPNSSLNNSDYLSDCMFLAQEEGSFKFNVKSLVYKKGEIFVSCPVVSPNFKPSFPLEYSFYSRHESENSGFGRIVTVVVDKVGVDD